MPQLVPAMHCQRGPNRLLVEVIAIIVLISLVLRRLAEGYVLKGTEVVAQHGSVGDLPGRATSQESAADVGRTGALGNLDCIRAKVNREILEVHHGTVRTQASCWRPRTQALAESTPRNTHCW